MTEEHPRRTIIGGIATALVGFAGCLGGPIGGTTSSPTPATAFQDVSVDGQSIVVTLSSNTKLDRVNVIGPNGEQFTSTQVATGAQQVSLRLGTDYQPGDYRVVGVSGGSEAAETTLSIRPDVQIKRIGVGANHIDEMPDSLGTTQDEEALVKLKNTGNGPTKITKLLFLGKLPGPTTDIQNSSNSGIFNVKDGAGSVDGVPLNAEGAKTLFSSTLPFSFQGKGEDCGLKEKTGTFQVVVKTTTGSTQAEYEIKYSASEEYNGCSLSISRGNQHA